MRTALVSLIALAGLAPTVFAQVAAPSAPPAASPAAEPVTPPAAAAPAAMSPAPMPAAPATTAPTAPAPMSPAPMPATTAPAAMSAPAAPSGSSPATLAAPSATDATAGAASAAPAAPALPPPPPPAPTDPTAIALLSTLETVCIPSAAGGNLSQIAKAAGFRKSGDNFVRKAPGYQLTVQSNAYNPTQCHVDIVHAVDADAPAKPLVVALHNWAAVSRGWDLYRNDKSVQGAQQFTTRSWEHSADGKSEALVLTTVRKPDGKPMKGDSDTSMMIYNATKTPG